VSKTNHPVLRYRDPVYKTLRELALSYFHEYFDKSGRKSLRNYSLPFSLLRYDPHFWVSGKDDLIAVVNDLEDSRHYTLVKGRHLQYLRSVEPYISFVSDITQWNRKGKRGNFHRRKK